MNRAQNGSTLDISLVQYMNVTVLTHVDAVTGEMVVRRGANATTHAVGITIKPITNDGSLAYKVASLEARVLALEL